MGQPACCSSDPEIFCAALAALGVDLDLERDLLTFGEAGKTCALDSTHVNEYVAAAVVRLNEAKSLLAVEPVCTENLIRVYRVTESPKLAK